MYPYQRTDSFLALVFAVAFYALELFLYARIVRRAGFEPPRVLLLILPFAPLIASIVFAFREWPIHRELAALHAENQQLRDALRDARVRME